MPDQKNLGTHLLKGTLQEIEILNIARAILKSLETVHASGLLHRNIKPDNIFLTDDGRTVLIDLGPRGHLRKAKPKCSPGGSHPVTPHPNSMHLKRNSVPTPICTVSGPHFTMRSGDFLHRLHPTDCSGNLFPIVFSRQNPPISREPQTRVVILIDPNLK